jgi:hypothetical protein
MAILLSFVLAYIPPEWVCVRWTWTGDVFNRKVICLEWKKRDDKK